MIVLGRLREKVTVEPPKEERIVAYVTKQTKARWQKMLIDMDTRNYEEAINALLDLYELCSRYTRKKSIKDVVKILRMRFTVQTKLQFIEPD